jgi:acetolactate synthase-1/2/3 large subunit
VETAAAGGVDTWFANPGTTELSLVAALDEVPSARAILGLFEGVCTGAADGYARMAGRPAATLLHLGPGLGNGLANLHNARRAGSGMLNVVGDHPTWHRAADAPLTTDVPMLASPMSDWVRTAGSAATLAGDAAEALAVAGAGGVATLVVPADCQWSPAPGGPLVPPAAPPRSAGDAAPTVSAALRGAERAVLLLGGSALSERGLRAAERVAAASGCRLLVETFPARLERGGGLPSPPRLAYFPDQAAAALADAGLLVLAGARDPVPFFGYPDGRRKLTAPGTQVLSAAAPTEDAERALEELADLAGAPPRAPAAGQAGAPSPAAADHAGAPSPAAPAPARAGATPELPTGRLTVEALGAAVAACQPEGAIVVDEAVTSGVAYHAAAARAARHTVLSLTGGSIGFGPPCATGAAVACPDRHVINLQADGSAAYTLQALWTQAREQLHVTTVVCANRAYRILLVELQRSGMAAGGPATAALTDLGEPALDWASLARGFGVPAARAGTADELVAALRRALAEPGPYLVEALL